jgi:hypothetical protein
MKTEELVKSVETLKHEKNLLSSGVLKLKKIIEDLKKKNNEKAEALKSIRNFFLTSTVFKVKSISDIEDKSNINNQTPSYLF